MNAVILEQIFLNLACSYAFVSFLCKKFNLKEIEGLLLFVLSLIPHSVFMPEGMSTGMIVTEALAFPLFYLLMMAILEAVWSKKLKYCIVGFGIAIMLSLTRTQLQLTFLLPFLAVFYIFCCKATDKKYRKIWYVIQGVGVGFFLFIIAYGLYRQANIPLVVAHEKLNQQSVVNDVADRGERQKQISEGSNIGNQISGVFNAKMIFTSEDEDRSLFTDEDMRQAFDELYNGLYEKHLLLASMTKDLTIADQIFNNMDNVYRAPRIILGESENLDLENLGGIGNVSTIIAKTLFRAHPLRWLKSGMLQLPSGLISTVFFHKRAFYWFSYLVTGLIYLSAFILIGFSIRMKRDRKGIEFMAAAVLTNLVFVSASAVVYMALQRYVIYGFGLFYMAFYVLLKSLVLEKWKLFGKTGERDAAEK